MKKFKFILAALALPVFLLTACDDDEGKGPSKQELITTVRMDFFEINTADSLSFTVTDLDGEGGNPPIAEAIKLKANTSYVYHTLFSDESDLANVTDFSQEIVDEATAHLVCYTVSNSVFELIIGDSDGDGKPLGLIGALTTGAAVEGTLRVVLKHEPDKSSADPCDTGETDVEVTFPFVVE